MLALVFLFVFTTPVFAHNRGLVLGEQTQTSVPALAAGPGFLLPDSPLWFLDDWRDQLKLFLTVNAQERANLEVRVAAERLAELKILLAQNSPRGIDIALANLVSHIDAARDILQGEKARGRDVAGLAHDLNGAIDQEQEFLDTLLEITRPQERFLVRNAQIQVAQDELEIENELGEDERENETLRELAEGTREEIQEASAAARRAQQLSRQLGERADQTQREQLRNQSRNLERILEQQRSSLETANQEADRLQEHLQPAPEEHD